MVVRLQEADFEVGAELAALRQDDARIGAIVSFVGLVRALNDDTAVSEMTLEHYPGMTENALEKIVLQAKARWNIFDARVIHRFGRLRIGEQIVLVAVSGAHRGDAFAACEFIIDRLKTEAPFWKREVTPHGARWVEARATDESAAERWQ
jgi:molybdopterin synthase catalytic subunit